MYVERGAAEFTNVLILNTTSSTVRIQSGMRWKRKDSSKCSQHCTIASPLSAAAAQTGGAIQAKEKLTVVNSVFASTSSQEVRSVGGSHAAAALRGVLAALCPVLLRKAPCHAHSLSQGSGECGGGAILSEGEVSVEGSVFLSASANASGGAICHHSSKTIAVVRTSTFNGSTSTGGSGGAVFSAGALTISASNFSQVSANVAGAAVAANVSLTVSGSRFSAATATSSGGALFCNGTATVSSSTFVDTSSGAAGGTIWASGLNVSRSSFLRTTGALAGGAIFVNGTAEVAGSNFSDSASTAGRGGAIEASSVNVSACSFFRVSSALEVRWERRKCRELRSLQQICAVLRYALRASFRLISLHTPRARYLHSAGRGRRGFGHTLRRWERFRGRLLSHFQRRGPGCAPRPRHCRLLSLRKRLCGTRWRCHLVRR